jgi:phage-related protein
MLMRDIPKPLVWVGSSKRDLKAFPRAVQRDLGQALEIAQFGRTPVQAKPLKGFKGAGVLELVEDHDGDTYRAVYTVKLKDRVYVLHAFQKKSKTGIKTPKPVIDLVRARLQAAGRIQAELEGQG